VLAIDADPAMNLAYALGINSDVTSKIIPLTENVQLIEERTGVKNGTALSPIFRLTPTVDDIADKYGVVGPDNVRLLVMGTVRSGGSGCMCPANTLIRALIRHITLERFHEVRVGTKGPRHQVLAALLHELGHHSHAYFGSHSGELSSSYRQASRMEQEREAWKRVDPQLKERRPQQKWFKRFALETYRSPKMSEAQAHRFVEQFKKGEGWWKKTK